MPCSACSCLHVWIGIGIERWLILHAPKKKEPEFIRKFWWNSFYLLPLVSTQTSMVSPGSDFYLCYCFFCSFFLLNNGKRSTHTHALSLSLALTQFNIVIDLYRIIWSLGAHDFVDHETNSECHLQMDFYALCEQSNKQNCFDNLKSYKLIWWRMQLLSIYNKLVLLVVQSTFSLCFFFVLRVGFHLVVILSHARITN